MKHWSDGLCPPGMDFHEDLSQLGEKEGLKGQKMSKAVESFTWNITVLKVIFCRFFMEGGRAFFKLEDMNENEFQPHDVIAQSM